jgi:hypothetical protein
MTGRRDDRGATLVMAIVFVTVIGMVIAGALGYASVSLHASSRVYIPARDRLYAADLAMKATTEFVKQHHVEGRALPSGACHDVKAFGEADGEPVKVQVCPQSADSLVLSGAAGEAGFTALAVAPEAGLTVSGDGQLLANGNVSVASLVNIAVNSSLSVVGGSVSAPSGCTGTILVDGVPIDDATCSVGAAAPTDPGYLLGVTSPPPAASGTCNGTTKIATLQPGSWTTSASLTTAIGSCTMIAMVPGVHVLSGVDWVIKDKVVAGTLNGSIATSAIPGGCVDDGAGVTIVLAGASTIALSGSNASLQVCGRNLPQSSTKVAIYGPPSSVTTTLSDTLVPSSNPTGSTWVSPANAKLVDGLLASYNSLSKGSNANVLTFPTVLGAAAFPVATVTPITAEVTGLATQAVNFTLQVRSNGTTACTSATVALPLTTLATVSTTFTCTRALVAPLSIRFNATAVNTGTARNIQLDGVVLKYSVAGASIAAQSGCVVAVVGGCDAVSMNNAGGQLWLGGRVYLPRAKMSIRLKDGSTVLSTQAMVVRSLSVTTSGPTSSGTVAADTVVQLRPGDVTIASSVGGRMSMTCRVTYAVAGAAVTGYTVQGCTIPH